MFSFIQCEIEKHISTYTYTYKYIRTHTVFQHHVTLHNFVIRRCWPPHNLSRVHFIHRKGCHSNTFHVRFSFLSLSLSHALMNARKTPSMASHRDSLCWFSHYVQPNSYWIYELIKNSLRVQMSDFLSSGDPFCFLYLAFFKWSLINLFHFWVFHWNRAHIKFMFVTIKMENYAKMSKSPRGRATWVRKVTSFIDLKNYTQMCFLCFAIVSCRFINNKKKKLKAYQMNI